MRTSGSAALRDQRQYQIVGDSQPQQQDLAGAVDRHPMWAFTFVSALYFIVVFVQSSFKLLWLDELITLHLANLSSFHDLWHALAIGADPNPPITYVLVHWSRLIFGDHEFADRLPAALGYWVGLVFLFAYLKHRLRGSWAIFGCILSMTMAAFDYSFESRSYAIFYGLAMVSFLCWSITADPARRPAARITALVGMTLSLAAGISTNYFAVLAFLPLAAGELFRTFARMRRRQVSPVTEFGKPASREHHRFLRAIDLRVWFGFAVAASPLLVYRPLIAHSIAQFAPYAWNKVSLDQVFDSYTEMVEIILYPILALLAFGALVFFSKDRVLAVCGDCRSKLLPRWMRALFAPYRGNPVIPMREAVGIFVFMTYPICGYIIASIHGGMLSPRFVIPVCFGFAIAAAIAAQYLFRNLKSAATIMLCFVCAWFLCREAVVGYWYKEQKDSFYNAVHAIDHAEKLMPLDSAIAIPDPLFALTFRHYAPADLAARIVFPVDFPAIRYFRKDDSPEENLWAGRHFLYSMPVVPLATFQQSTGNYLILANSHNWLLKDLEKHRYWFAQLPIPTHAGDIGGFTPLAHGVPALYEAQGDRLPATPTAFRLPPAPFKLKQNLPAARWYAPPEPLDPEPLNDE